ncbi:flap endonuclease-1 [archaeon]|jgi:flap endonuclease-1|nr:flap endonuclease-1 [archaeon]MBT4241921.1 flap endonuclease-1 [archaeon]MBT4418468.1 flap endonuclease-1 [archaeon]
MGLQIGEIISKNEIEFKDLKNKTIAVDAFNAIYQFLTTIRQPDGTPLKDSEGNVTSHLSGLFYRNMKLILEGVKLIYVFDGEAPELKRATRESRRVARDESRAKYEEARDKEDIEGMGKYARAEVYLDEKKIKESKELLEVMGIAVVQAPGEGEAQASHLVCEGKAYAVASQDYDCLMFKAPKLIQNLSLARKRKTITGYREVFPQMIELDGVLKELEVNQEQLICLGILCGTDYNQGGVKGLGPKKGLKIVREFGSKEELFEALENNEKFEKLRESSDSFDDGKLWFDWKEIYDEIAEPNVRKGVEIEFPEMDRDKIKEILTQYEFSEDRIENQLKKLDELKKAKAQTTLF